MKLARLKFLFTRRALPFWALAATLPLLSHSHGTKAQTVPPVTLTFASSADTYVDAGSATANNNSSTTLKVDASPVRIGLLRFAVTGVNGRTVQQARLRMLVTTAGDGGSLHTITSNLTWNETTVTYNTRPGYDPTALATLGAVAKTATAEWVLDGKVTQDGVYNFALDTTNSAGVAFNSAAATSGLKPTLVLTLAATPPTLSVTQPADGASFFVGDTITFQGGAQDSLGSSLASSISWRTDLNTSLGTGAVVQTSSLPQGSRTITASVTDSQNLTSTAQVHLTIAAQPPVNTPPLVAITAPTAGQILAAGSPVTFTGTATDLEDGSLSASLAWTSDRDGALGTGATFSRTLSQGTHQITATVTDHGGLAGTATVSVQVMPAVTVEFPAIADAHVDAGLPTTNFGASSVLRVDANTVRNTYLRFTVTGVGSRNLVQALLRLQVDSVVGAESDSGGTVIPISDGTWQENAITYNTRPLLDGAALATMGPVTLGQTVNFDVTRAVTGDGTYNFALVNASADEATYRSKEGGPAPTLVLILSGNPPTVTISAPPSGTVAFHNDSLTFTGQANDIEDGDLSSQIHWTSSRDGDLGTGPTVSTSGLTVGTHTITASATDHDGLQGQATITVRVRNPNAPPTVTISAPGTGTSVPFGTTVALAATASDDFDGNLSSQIQWTSNRDGALGTGASVNATHLTVGTHILTASVTDSDHATGSAQVTVTVTPTPPVVTVSAPLDGTRVFAGTAITFTGNATDAIDGNISTSLKWFSDRDGLIGTGASFVKSTLTTGTHTITAQATNHAGGTAQATRTVVIRPPNVPPTLAITSPATGGAFLTGKPILVAALATDPEDGDLSSTVRWTSSRDGALGTGTHVVASLSVGSHTITASVTDHDGATVTATSTITVSGTTLTFNAVADTYVDAAAATSKFGTTTSVLAGSAPVRQAFFRFPVTGVGSFKVSKALLHLTAGTASADASASAGTVNLITDNTWSETTMTYNTGRPAIDGPLLATQGAVKVGAAIDFDVTSGVTGDGSLNLALSSASSDWVRFMTREAGGSKQPVLTLTLDQNTPPVVTITAPASGIKILPGQALTFTGTATDAESGDVSSRIVWTSDRDGALGTGASITVSTLHSGAHTITARVTDAGGASGQAQIIVNVANAPVVTILAPANGAGFFAADLATHPVMLTGRATDVEDGDVSASLTWRSDRDGALASGATISASQLSLGTHVITATATDDTGLHGSASVTVVIRPPNQPPVIHITAPGDGGSTPAGTPTTLTASVTDDFDTTLESQVHWSSSRDGNLGTGTPRTVTLREGVHTLTASITDSNGGTSTASIAFTVTPTAPVVTITAPAVGTRVFSGTTVAFTGTAQDATDGTLTSGLRWISDRDGLIGTGGAFSSSHLSVGTHLIRASVNDAGGLEGSATRTVVIRPPNTPPAVTIISPNDNATLLTGNHVVLGAYALDADDGDVSASTRWSSSRDGALGTGAAVTVASLSVGTHTLTATATDLDGASNSASITVTVVSATLTFAPVADTYVDSGAATTKFGTATSMLVGSGPVRQAFLRFPVTGIGNLTVQQALLRLTAGPASADASAVGGSVQTLSDNTWSEAATTYGTRPAIDGPVVATRTTKIAASQVVDYDVTTAITVDKTYNFAVVSASTDFIRFMSRENSTGKPQLIVTLTQNTKPVVTITAPPVGTRVLPGTAVTFTGKATDAESGDLSALITWRSDRDGVLGTGASITTSTLSPGAHVVTAEVVDPAGLVGQAQVALAVAQPPVVAISTPADGSVFYLTDLPITLSAVATDPEDGDLSTHLDWKSDLEGPLASGPSIVAHTLRIGTHIITAGVTDSDGLRGEARVTVRVRGPNVAPVLQITTPADGGSTPAGTQVVLRASATDEFDGDLSGQVRWTSDRDGSLGTGVPRTLILSEGSHTITASVTDSDGAVTTTQIHFTVTPTAPVVTITSPAQGTRVFQGTNVGFSGTAIDATDGTLSAGLRWMSDRDGLIGSGASFSTAHLSPGLHTITASATDLGGLIGLAVRTITIRTPNIPPVVTLIAPTDGTSLLTGKPVVLAATAIDAEDGDLGTSLRWASSRDGNLGTGPTVLVASLSLGAHVITATVTDHDGAVSTATANVNIVQATISFNAIADTYVDSGVPTKIFGTATGLLAGSAPVRQAFYRFPVTGMGHLTAQQALLRLTVGSAKTDASAFAGTVNAISSNSWSEAATTYNNRPAIDGPQLATKPAKVAIKQVVDFDVTTGITGDATYNFAVTSTSSDWVTYASREASTGKPQLILTLKQNTNPVVNITAPVSGAIVNIGAPVTFTGTAIDAESGNLASTIQWTSDRDGALGTGATITVPHLSVGAHTITAQVTDPTGLTGRAQITLQVGHKPVVAITAPHALQVFFNYQLPITLTGSATDVEDGNLSQRLQWSSDRDGALGVGPSVRVSALTLGTHVLTASVTDANGESGQAQVTIRVRGPNQAPVLHITTPADGAQIPAGTQITLAASAQDDFDGDISSLVHWNSSRDGDLPAGAPQVTLHAEGSHTLTATVTDSDGLTSTAQITVTITPTPPVVTITSPGVGTTFVQDTSLSFSATALDATDGDLSASLQWSSDRDGPIGSGANFALTTLSEGTHTITAQTSDAGGLVGRAQLSLRVIRQPQVTILLPAPGDAFLTTTTVKFLAAAIDRVDGDVSANLTWTSDRDGVIGHGASFTTTSLSVGTHTVTARAVNALGNAGTATVTFTMQVGSLTFEPVADTYVDQLLSTTIFGTATDIDAVGSPTLRIAFLRFNVAGVGSFPIDHAILRLTVGSSSTSDGAQGGTINTITDNTWSEAATKWTNKPAIDGPVIDTNTLPVVQSQAVDFNVGAALHGDATYNFALSAGGSNAVKYDSREGLNHPKLIVFFSQPQTRQLPAVVITTPANNATVYDDQPATFTGTANDPHDGDLTPALAWKSSVDGPLGTGGTIGVAHLTRGTHTITASVQNSIHLTGSTAVALTVADRPPAVAITAPADNHVFAIGFPIQFTATASHAGDGDLGATIAWSSDRDGNFGTGRTVTTAALSPGDHVITATATDSLGTHGTASIHIAVGNSAPRLTVTGPADGTSVSEGTSVTLAATATDLEDGDLTPAISWTSDLQGALGMGGSIPIVLNAGTHHLSARVSDSNGSIKTAALTVTVTKSAPVLTILTPADGFSASGSVTFTGSAIDYRDGNRSAAITWSSDVAGPLGTGATVVAPHLSAGRHVITATVTDSDGLTATKVITIAIGYGPPTVTITGPAAGFSAAAGTPINFTGAATDGLDGTINTSIKWFSNLNGQIGTGGSFSTSTLARGTHTITARATDSKGLSGTAQIVVNVTASAGAAGNNPPQVTITSPASGAQVAAGSPVTFTATAIDEAGDIGSGLAWVSNIDGIIGSGKTFSTSTLSAGTHRITASVSDSGGLVGSASVAVTITSSAFTFPVVADAYTDNSTANAGSNFGTATFLRLQNSPVLRIFLRFNVTGLSAGPVARAVVRMTTTSATNSGALYVAGSGAEMHLISAPGTPPWDELTITSLNKPTIDTAILNTIETTVNPSQTLDFDVTSAITGNGTYDFGLKTLSGDRAEFLSKEAGTGAPQLVIFRDAPTATNPTVHITAPTDGTVVNTGASTVFTATATDPQDGNIAASLTWRSNKDGILGVGPQINATLSQGAHIITATAVDTANIAAADLIHVTVGSGAPTVTIVSPSNGSTAALGVIQPFIATAFDTRDGDLSFSISWTSSIDGPLGTGPSFARALSPGAHVITATVTDTDHNTVSATANFTVDINRVGYEDFSFGPSMEVALDKATATKQQSKLWYADGVWWGVLFNAGKSQFDIYRMDLPTQTWVDTGILVDDRGKSRQDCLLDGTKLYIVSRYGFDGATPPSDRLMRYTYFPGAQTYALDTGFPVNLGATNAEAVTIAKDTTGKLWISYESNSVVFTRHTLTSDTDWGAPFQVPAAEGNPTTTNDDSATIAMPGGRIGIYWGNQSTAKCYFALHTDGMSDTDPAAWTFEIAGAGSSIADDHANLKLASDGRLFAVQKTSRTTPGQTLIGLFVRSTTGVWTPLIKVANVDVDPTRPSMALDEVNRKVYVFYASFFSDVYYKVADMDNPVFDGTTVGTPLMKSGTTPLSPSLGGPGGINNPSGTKQNPDPSTGILMIAATSETNRYWHNWVYLPTPKPTVTLSAPADGVRVKAGAAVSFSGTANSGTDGNVTSSINWNSSRDGQIGTGGSFSTSTLTVGTHVVTASVTDSTKLTGSAKITITVEQDVAPVVTITAPTQNQKLRSDQPVSFSGTAIDSFDGDRSSALTWTSNRDGSIGSGGGFAHTLSVGAHTITARATDTGGLVGTATVNITVAAIAPPTLSVTAPADGKLFAFGAAVPFAATSSDTFDGDTTSRISWASDRDGQVGSGGLFTRSTLTRGVHHLTASVTDTNGLTTTLTRTITIVDDAPPVVTISAPTATLFPAGKSITFTGSALDQIDGDRTSTLVWTSNRDGQIGTGATFATSTLTVGTHVVTAAATDAANLTGTAQVTFEVRVQPAPTVAITAPADATKVLFGDDVTFTGTATDTIDGDIASGIQWRSDKNGLLGTGASIVAHNLSIGTHTITASSTNSGNLTGTATIHLIVASGPQISILAPVDMTVVAAGDPVTFTGLSFDFEDGDLSSSLAWSSSLDGALGTGGTITVTLSRGVHTITATSTDHDGNTAHRQIGIEAVAKPTVIIATPANNALFGFGQAIALTAFATDPVDGAITSSIAWSSNLDGALGTGGSLSVTTLRSGTHTITAQVTNHRGFSGQKQVTVVVNDPPTITISAPTNNAAFAQGNPVTLTANASDREDGNITAQIAWSSSRDGNLGTGGTLTLSTLSPGLHTITASITDSGGRTATANRAITISGRPSVTVTAPLDGVRIQLGDAVTFTATATDFEDGSLTDAITWTSLRDGALGTGGSITVSTLSAGTHTIVASATDHDGLTGQKSLTVIVNAPPVVTITSPTSGALIERGTPVTFTATATDTEDGNIAANLHWTSNLDGALGTGATVMTSALRSGQHTITATVTDSAGKQVSATITIKINASPTVTITAPAHGTVSSPGSPIVFTATATDPEDGPLTAAIVWTSSLEPGTLGTGGTITVSTLRSGTHTITASVTDTDGKTTTDQLQVIVNAAPTISITAPTPNSTFEHGAAITFTATASDTEDGNLSANVAWTSNLDALLGSGASITTSTLRSGTHTITASVTDAGGRTTTATVTIIVNSTPTVSITAPATGAVFEHGDTIPFAGTATDLEDGTISSSITWSSSLDGALGTGATLPVATLRSGTHTITASITDAGGKSATSTITVVVDSKPVVGITAPASGAVYAHGDAVTLTATATDLEDGPVSGSIAWTSSISGTLGSGPSITVSTLGSGTHTITATATDSGGRTGSATITVVVNSGPTVSITAPASGSIYSPGDTVHFTGTASDLEDGTISANIHWTDGATALGTGAAIDVSTLASGSHTITATITDAGGKMSSASITVVVNAAPTVSISAPANNAVFSPGDTITFTGSASDAEDGALSTAIVWTSGATSLGTGASVSTSSLTSGSHTVTATVTDAGGKTTTATVTVVVNAAPTVGITSPATGSVFAPTDTITFTGTANDTEDGSLSTAIHWTSSLDGALGDAASINVTLHSGTHTITASVTDAGGKTASASITVVVNAAPTVAITAPASGSVFSPGDTVHLTGSASDAEDGPLSAAIHWTDGATALGTGPAVDASTLASGTHTITASVTDAGGKTASASITVVVNAAPTVAITAPASGSVFSPGDTIHLAGTANDTEDGSLSAAIHWTAGATALGTGATLDVSTLASGTYTITATVTDAGGKSGSASITVTVNAAPTVSITTPTTGSVFSPGDTVTCAGIASDAEDGNLSSAIVWTSGATSLGTGASISTSTLASGSHVITATVTDAGGKTATASITVAINAAPTVSITAPATGSVFSPGDTVTFTGSASDAEDGTLSSAIVWTSGATSLGTGASVSTSSLASGSRTITASVTDAGGKTATASITVVINAAPTVSITAPATGSVFEPSDTIHVTGSATDAEDGSLSSAIVWTTGATSLGTGAALDVVALGSGSHILTATVTDAGGKTATASITVVINATPTVAITAPADGSVYSPADPIHFTGTANDAEDGPVASGIHWTSGATSLGTGPAVDTSSFTSGSHVVTASVTDAGGKTATASITVVVNAAPAVAITAPANGSVFVPGDTIHFTGTASDAEDGPLASSIQWTSGATSLGTGAALDVSTLSSGGHVVTASVTDAGGKTATASITVIVNAAPTLTIIGPSNGAVYSPGDTVSFAGSASDTEDGPLSASIVWTSGATSLGTGATVSTTSFTSGSHTVTASVTDAGGKTASASVTVVVNAAPTVAITAPANNSVFSPGDTIHFVASASDAEDGSLGATVLWTSGATTLGTGATLDVSSFTSGSHTVTATVTDAGGKTASASVTVTVNAAPTIQITGPADGAIFSPTDTIHLTGIATDAEDGGISSAIHWTEGATALGTGASVDIANPSAGSHVFTATITDAGGKTATASITVTVNAAPTLTIDAPAGGSVYLVGDTIHFAGTATDAEDGPLSASIHWTAGATSLGTGATLDVSTLAAGSHTVTATVTDAGGKTATTTVTVIVDTAPTVAITAPADGTVYLVGDTIHLAGTATDAEDGTISTSIAWTTGATTLGSGATLDVAAPSAGSYTITATITDANGKTATASIGIVVDTAPTVAIDAPANGSVSLVGDTIHFAGTATDAEDGTISANIVWTTGATTLGTGATLDVSSLAAGSHTVTATVTDARGKSATASVSVIVDTAPGVVIDAPATGTVYLVGDTIHLAGTATDAEDGTISANIVWTTGATTLGTGAALDVAAPSAGSYTITATITDARGKTATASVGVVVDTAPTVTIDAPATGTVYLVGDTVHLAGTATDAEDGTISASIVWSEGATGLGSGGTLDVSTFAAGSHTITATITDARGKTASASVGVIVDTAPSVAIDAPANGALYLVGDTIHLAGTATDAEDGTISANIVWTTGATTLGTGATLDVGTLAAGTYTITATITDASGKTATASIGVVVDTAPTVTIDAPANGTVYLVGDTVHLAGTASDAEDGTISASIAWSEGATGLGTGATLDVSTFTAGSHTITATVTDARGKTASASIGVVVDTAPTVSIDAPASGALYLVGETIHLAGSASDAEDGPLGASIVWTTGATTLGTGATLDVSTLTAGSHTITATVTDASGKTASASIGVVVDTAPTVSIDAPASGSVALVGDTIHFAGTAGDAEDGPLGASIVWTTGATTLGTGATLDVSSLAAGSYVVTATVTDSNGKSASASIGIIVDTTPTVSIDAPADGTLYLVGDPIHLAGTAGDAEDGDISANIVWSTNATTLGTGATLDVTAPNAGTYTITATITDANGQSATASIGIVVDTAPTISIDAPADNTVAVVGDTIHFAGTAADAEDGPLSGAIAWTDGATGLGSGATLDVSSLAAGSHTITATVTDASDKSASASITVLVDTAPTVTITGPADGSTFLTTDTVSFTATAADAEDGTIDGNVVWSEGATSLGTGASLDQSFAAGSHTITATITDANGVSANTSISIEVQ